VDIRGHGASGNAGDIAYLGQLEDDMADLVAEIRKTNRPRSDADRSFLRRRICAAHRRLADPEPVRADRAAGALFGYDAPSSRPNSGGWANPIFRASSRCRCCADWTAWAESLPAIAFAVPPNSSQRLTATYSYRLMRNFAASRDFHADLARRPSLS